MRALVFGVALLAATIGTGIGATDRTVPADVAPAATRSAMAAPKDRPSAWIQVQQSSARPGQTVQIVGRCEDEPSTFGTQGPVKLPHSSPGKGDFHTFGWVADDASDGTARIVLVCGDVSKSDSFEIKKFGTTEK